MSELDYEASIDNRTAQAFAPAHLTGFFERIISPSNPLESGSRGAGLSLNEGLLTKVSLVSKEREQISVYLNNHLKKDAIVSKKVWQLFLSRITGLKKYCLKIQHFCKIPIGAGFGSSGAAALSLAYAINSLFNSPLSKDEAGQIAHLAELECKTGLGTVLADTAAGLEIRIKAGAPGIGKVLSFNLPAELEVYCFVCGPLETKKILADEDFIKKINKEGAYAVENLLKKPSALSFISLASAFSQKVGIFTPRLKSIWNNLCKENIIPALAMFGEVVFFFQGLDFKPVSQKLMKEAEARGATLYKFKLAKTGAILI